MSSSLVHCVEDWLFWDAQKDTWRVFHCHGSVTSSQHDDDGLKMMIITWRHAVSAHHPFAQGVTLLCWCIRLIHHTLWVILSLRDTNHADCWKSGHERKQRRTIYLLSWHFYRPLQIPSSAPSPSSVFHHSRTYNGPSASIPLWTGQSIGSVFTSAGVDGEEAWLGGKGREEDGWSKSSWGYVKVPRPTWEVLFSDTWGVTWHRSH